MYIIQIYNSHVSVCVCVYVYECICVAIPIFSTQFHLSLYRNICFNILRLKAYTVYFPCFRDKNWTESL